MIREGGTNRTVSEVYTVVEACMSCCSVIQVSIRILKHCYTLVNLQHQSLDVTKDMIGCREDINIFCYML